MRLVAMRLFVFLFFVALWESLSHIVLSNSPLPPNVLLAESRRRVDYCPVTAPVCRRPVSVVPDVSVAWAAQTAGGGILGWNLGHGEPCRHGGSLVHGEPSPHHMWGAKRTSSLPRIAPQSTVPIHDRAGQHAPIVIDSGMPSESVHPPLTARENRRRHGALPEGPPALTVPQKRDSAAGTRRHAIAATRPVATRPSPHDTSPCDSAPCDTSPCGSVRVVVGGGARSLRAAVGEVVASFVAIAVALLSRRRSTRRRSCALRACRASASDAA